MTKNVMSTKLFHSDGKLRQSKATLALLIVNVVAFGLTADWDLSISESALHYRYGYNVQYATVQTALTSMFMHANIVHLALNMIALVVIGPAIEKHFGRATLVALFIGSGIAGTTLHTIAYPDSTIPIIGASAGLMGLFGLGFAVGDGLSKEIILIQVCLFILTAVLMENNIDFPFVTNIGYMAHFGGFGFGYILTKGIMRLYSKKVATLDERMK